jgi:hypothetical protein
MQNINKYIWKIYVLNWSLSFHSSFVTVSLGAVMERFYVTQKPVELDMIANCEQTIKTKRVTCFNDKISQLNCNIWINAGPKTQKKNKILV